MLRVNCDSTPPISPSPSPLSSCHSSFQGGSWNNGQICKDHGVLNMATRPYSFTPDVTLGKILADQSCLWSPCSSTLSSVASNGTPNSKSSEELVNEITSLEMEILGLERYLLSLYRTTFEQHLHTSHLQPRFKLKPDAIPKSSSRRERKATRYSLGDHLGTPCTDISLVDGPDGLSQDIIRCISCIYCKLSKTGPLVSSINLSDTWDGERGPYAEMIHVLKIGPDDDTFNYAARMLKHFRTLVKKLENVDPGKMKREQKLAFWINIHNALVMHAYLAYGTHNNSKSNSILKATYNIGGHCINAYTIQISILGIKSHFRAPWLQSLLSPGRKLKMEPNKHVYAIEYPEPLVHFALSLGAFSDPAVRIYNAKNVFQDLRLAKEEFIQSMVYVNKETRIYLPRILYYFAKDMALSMGGVLEIVNGCVTETQHKAMKTSIKGKPEKYIHWLSQSCIFRYVIHGDAILV